MTEHRSRRMPPPICVILEVFRAPQFMDVSLSDWITHTPPAMVAQHLNVSEATIAKFPKNKPEIVPV
jgi:oxalate decarboxylase